MAPHLESEAPFDQEADRSAGTVNRRRFIVGGTAAALTASALLGSAGQAAAATAGTAGSAAPGPTRTSKYRGLTVGAGKAAINIPATLLPLDNFTVVHDNLYVKVLLVESPTTRIALVVLDLTSIGGDATVSLRSAITAASGVAPENILITVTHNFSSPHVMASTSSAQEAIWVSNIVAAAAAAVADAVKSLKPAKVGYGVGSADVNVNRNVLTADGYWLGVNEHLPSDKSVNVARFDDADGNPIAILTNYNVQSCVMQDSVMNNGDLPITADLAGAACAHVEAQYPGAIGFWLVGACGDQFPGYRSKRYTIDKNGNWTYGVDLHDAGFALLEAQGERLGNEIVRVAATIKPTTDAKLRLITESVTVDTMASGHPDGPVKTYTYTKTGTEQAPIWLLRIGAGAFAGAEPELDTSTALAIRKGSPFQHTFVMSMLEGGAKNMADKWNYDHFTYPARDSSYVRGDAEKLAAQMDKTLRLLR